MKKFTSVLFAVLVPLVAANASGAEVYGVKVECAGNCSDVNIPDVCSTYAQIRGISTGLFAYAVSCDDTIKPLSGGYTCGAATCYSTSPSLWYSSKVGDSCSDGGSRDAIVMCSDRTTVTGSYGPPLYYIAKVECNGDCDNVTLGNLCMGYMPSGVSCDTVSSAGTAASCGSGSGSCKVSRSSTGLLDNSIGLASYCQDGSGVDAIVTCTGVDLSRPYDQYLAVKVECSGDCGAIALGDACDRAVSGSKPVQISCNGTVGNGTEYSGYGSFTFAGGASIFDSTAFRRTDKVGQYCADGSGYDAIVTCRNFVD